MDAVSSGSAQQAARVSTPGVEPTFACSPPPGAARVEVVLAAVGGVVPAPLLRRLPQGYRPLLVRSDGRAHGADRGLAAAWAEGLRRAAAPVVVLVDARCGVDLRELERVAEPVARGSADLVLGSRRPGFDLASLLAWPPHRRLADAAVTRRLVRRLESARLINARLDSAGADEGANPVTSGIPALRPADAGRVLAGRRQLLAAVNEPSPEVLLVAAVSHGWRTAQVPVRCASAALAS